MSNIDILALRFAEQHADEVARLAAEEPTESIVSFLESLPPVTAAGVAARLTSRQLVPILKMLEPRAVAALLTSGQHRDRVAIFAHLPTASYSTILEAAPANTRDDLRRLFHFPQENLAALASTDFTRVTAETLCSVVKKELETAEGADDRPIIVVARDGTYQGILAPLAVVSNRNASLPVSNVMLAVDPLRGAMPVTAALSAPQWREHSALAVVDGEGQILGAITEAQLWLATGKQEPVPETLEHLVEEVAGNYLWVCAELFENVLGARRQ